MLLTKRERQKIRSIEFHKHYELDKYGNPSETDTDEFDLDIEKLRNHIGDKIRKMGFKVEKVNPSKANCIIRVYKGYYNYDTLFEGNKKYCIFGADCFTKGCTKNSVARIWITDNNGYDCQICFSKWLYKIWFWQDEYITVDTEFFDTYLRVSKKR